MAVVLSKTDSSIIRTMRSVSRCAVAAGTMSIAITTMAPTDSRDVTVTTATNPMSR